MDYASVNDVIALWKELDLNEIEKVNTLIPLVSSCIRFEGARHGKDTEQMALLDPDWANVAKIVTVAVVKRYMNESDESTQLTQSTQSALGYSLTGTFVTAGGGIKLLNNELKQLGFKAQRLGVIEMM